MRVRALLCKKFNISWSDYGTLTVREQGILVQMVKEEQDQMKKDARKAKRSNTTRTRM